MRAWLVLVAVLGGCDAVFGTGQVPPDFGHDGATDTLGSHDEDHDGRIDSEDNCPLDALVDHDDFDIDQVGNGCDPHTNAADRLVSLTTFEQNRGNWNILHGSSALANDELELDDAVAVTEGGYVDPTVVVRVGPPQSNFTGASVSVFIGQYGSASLNEGVECAITWDTSGFRALAVHYVGGSATIDAQAAVAPATSTRIAARRDGTCTFLRDANVTLLSAMPSTVSPFQVGFEADIIAASFTGAAIYDH